MNGKFERDPDTRDYCRLTNSSGWIELKTDLYGRPLIVEGTTTLICDSLQFAISDNDLIAALNDNLQWLHLAAASIEWDSVRLLEDGWPESVDKICRARLINADTGETISDWPKFWANLEKMWEAE